MSDHHRVLISGASGLVGRALTVQLKQQSNEVFALTRSAAGSPAASIAWDPSQGRLAAGQLEGFDAVVHLAGEGIAVRRWSRGQKDRIRESRIQGTSLLAKTLAGLERKPRVLVSASAIGYYGDRGDEALTEDAACGTGFLADVCREWEAATSLAEQAGIRVVRIRIGIVLSREGGALQKMLTPFRLGVGGVIGSGRQYMSWIALDDLVSVIQYALQTESLRGPVNAVSPQAVTNRDFTKTLGRVLHRPTIFPLPAFAARIVIGEMADALLLASARVVPARLQATGFTFAFPELENALRHALATGNSKA